MTKRTWWLTTIAGAALISRLVAQQGPPAPQIPQPIFRAPEDTWKTGVKPDDIKAGVRPDYTKLRDRLIVIPVQGRIHLIGGAGANIAVQVSDEGTLLVDAGEAAAADKVIAEIKTLQIRPVRWIIDTNADLDHTGGNGTIAKTGVAAIAQGGVAAPGGGGGAFFGSGARLIAFEKVMNRMSAPTGQRSPRETADWPTDTFFTARKNFWFGGEPIEMWHVPAAHSESDVMVFFRKSDVIVAGDVIAADRYPYIDAKNGGSLQRHYRRAEPDRGDGGTGIQPAGRHAHHSWPRTRIEPERRGRVPGHGHHHPRPYRAAGERGQDARAGQGRTPDA